MENISEMNYTELRIGNWVQSVELVRPVKVAILEAHGSDTRPEINGWEEKDIIPIELTPEILEKAGFEISGSRVHAVLKYRATDTSLSEKEYALILFDEFRDGVYVYQTGNLTSFRRAIKYVHELQNLFHALTGEELNIEL